MKRILFLLLAVLSLASCDKEEIVIPQRHAGRTVLAFLWADNSLNNNLRENIGTMMSGLQQMTDSATLVVYWDGKTSDKNWSVPTIVRYTTNGRGSINSYSRQAVDELLAASGTTLYDLIGLGETMKTYPSQTSTEKEVMRTVIADMMACYPSQSYGIIFGSHGSGWLPTITGSRSIGQDGGEYSDDTALIPELAEVLCAVNPQKFDFVLFDACMMGCAEVYYELKDAADYCIASVLEIPAAGFPYADVMPYLYESDIRKYLEPICRSYISYSPWGTISAVDCSRMEELAAAVREVIVSRGDRLNAVDTDRLQQYGGYSTFKGYAYDLVQYVETLCEGEVPASFREQFDQALCYTAYVTTGSYPYPIDGENYCGMGMYIPNGRTSGKYGLWNDYFRSSVAWYSAAGWADTESIWGSN